MSKIIYGLYLPLVFPEGLAPGCGSDFNTLLLARDGKNRPVLRGTALAGALRHACGKTLETAFFGSSCGEELDEGSPSRLKVPDVPLRFDPKKSPEDTRTHHLRNRHTNVVLDGALFSLESCPPGTLAEALLWLDGDSAPESKVQDEAFISRIASFFAEETGGFLLGGSAARGIGRAIFQPGKNPLYCVFDFSNAKDLGTYLNFRQKGPSALNLQGWQNVPAGTVEAERLTVHFKLKIPRGQDFLIANGDAAPQRVRAQNGQNCWRIPGSTLRGLFRSWVTRLAAREGSDVVDSYNKFRNEYQLGTTKYDGDSLAWLFVEKMKRKAEKESLRRATPGKYPVQYLFGTAFQRGRIHFSDALVPFEETKKLGELPPEENFRSHVRIDPITGGFVPGGLFSNTTLTSRVNRTFSVTLFVENPQEKEAKWLAQTLRALDMGLLRLGSSKASGRVSLAEVPNACGTYSELFSSIKPFEMEK